ncbi:MAG: PKD domain-containing protein [Bacteroidota bacterium]
MRTSWLRLAVACLFCSCWFPLQAQLTVSDTLSRGEMIGTLFGEGVIVSNINYQLCDTSRAMWEFDGSAASVSLDRGLLLSTGECIDAQNPFGTQASSLLASTPLGMPGYTPLNSLLPPGFSTNDACVITFDIVPLCDSIAIKYIFASEEYPGFVNSMFNDVFAFFISGPGFGAAPGTNIALVPGTNIPVSINNVNNGQSATGTVPTGPCTNCAFYNDYTFGTTLSYNAFTKTLLAEASVQQCSTYTITLAIADGGDSFLDSGVFLEAEGIGCTSQALTLKAVNNASANLGTNVTVEGCSNGGEFIFTLPNPLPDTTVFYFDIGGTAVPGVDYDPLPDSIIMPAGQTSFTVPLNVVDDGIFEGVETLQLIYTDSALCGSIIYADTAQMEIWDKPNLTTAPDAAICDGETATLGFTPNITHTYAWSPGTYLSDPTISNPVFTRPNNDIFAKTQTYVLTTTSLQGYCILEDTVEVTVHPVIETTFAADTVCLGVPTQFADLTRTDAVSQWTWRFGDGNQDTQDDPQHVYTQPGTYQAFLRTENAYGCADSFELDILVDSLPIVAYAVAPVCEGFTSIFVGDPRPNIQYFWEFGDQNTSTLPSPTHLYGISGDFNTRLMAETVPGCRDTFELMTSVRANPVADFTSPSLCQSQVITMDNLSQTGTGQTLSYLWDLGEPGATSTDFEPSRTYNQFGPKVLRLRVTDEFGCVDSARLDLEVYPVPTANFEADPICNRNQMPIRNTSSLAGGGNITQWAWTFGDRTGIVSKEVPNPYFTEAGIYDTRLVVTSEDGCVDSITQAVTVYPIPVVNFNTYPACVGDSVLLLNQSSVESQITGDFIQFTTWTLGDGSPAATQLDSVWHIYNNPGDYDISLRVVSDKGCEALRRGEVEVYPLPDGYRLIPDTVCWSDQALLQATAPSNLRMQWYYDPQGTEPFQIAYSFVTPPQFFETTYYVQAFTEFGCESPILPINTYLYESGEGAIVSNQAVLNIPDAEASFRFQGSVNPETYLWDFGNGVTSTEVIGTHQYTLPGIYPVKLFVVDIHGCEYEFATQIEIKKIVTLHIPSAFSPNGDGVNDRWFVGHQLLQNFQIQVFNRWGQMVFQSQNLDFQWDGFSLSGQRVPEGVYVYHITATDLDGIEITEKGTVTIAR